MSSIVITIEGIDIALSSSHSQRFTTERYTHIISRDMSSIAYPSIPNTLKHTHTHTETHTDTDTDTHTQTHTYTHTRTHTHAHTQTQSLTHKHTLAWRARGHACTIIIMIIITIIIIIVIIITMIIIIIMIIMMMMIIMIILIIIILIIIIIIIIIITTFYSAISLYKQMSACKAPYKSHIHSISRGARTQHRPTSKHCK